jgi:ribosome-associated protein
LKTAITPKKTAKSSQAPLTRNSKLFKTIIQAIQEKKGESILSLDLKKIDEAIAEFFVICQAGNPIQLGAIIDEIEKQVREHCGEKPFKVEGGRNQHWVIIDYVNIVVHCFLPETRKLYNIEDMWSDADFKEHKD